MNGHMRGLRKMSDNLGLIKDKLSERHPEIKDKFMQVKCYLLQSNNARLVIDALDELAKANKHETIQVKVDVLMDLTSQNESTFYRIINKLKRCDVISIINKTRPRTIIFDTKLSNNPLLIKIAKQDRLGESSSKESQND